MGHSRDARSFRPCLPTLLALALLAPPAGLAGCATTSAPPGAGGGENSGPGGPATPAAASGPTDLAAAMAVELPAPLPRSRVTMFKGQVTGEVEAAGPIKNDDGKAGDDGEAAELNIPLGKDSELTCLVYPESTDPAGTIAKVLAAAAKEVQFQRVRVRDVVMLGDHPAVYIDAEYTANGPEGKLFGFYKLMLHAHRDHPVFCQHDEVGFAATFRRITQDFVKSLKSTMPATDAKFLEVHVIKLGDQPVGFEQQMVTAAENGMRVATQSTSMFLPRSQRDLSMVDDLLTDVTDGGGTVEAVAFAKGENGELSSTIELERAKERQYTFKGKHAGKEVTGGFRTKGRKGPMTRLAVAEELRRQLLNGKAKELTMEEYHPGVDPTKPMNVVYRRGAGRAVTVVVGAIEMQATLDERGLLDRGELAMGSHKLIFTRAFIRGTP